MVINTEESGAYLGLKGACVRCKYEIIYFEKSPTLPPGFFILLLLCAAHLRARCIIRRFYCNLCSITFAQDFNLEHALIRDVCQIRG